ncbi:hypothetical protein LTR17_001191 [Elasticomyces elasticus]|nr:hypothetical protein LTR17_001191 [Elasticomyces elasticus]
MAEDGERPKKVRRLASSKPKLGHMVTVCVGTGSKARDFFVYEGLLCQHSDFFKAALTGGRWQESIQRKVSLPEDEPETFEDFQCFLLAGRTFFEDAAQRKVLDGISRDDEYRAIANAWTLADKLQSCSYKDATTDTLALKVVANNRYPTGMQYMLAKGNSASAGFARFIVDTAVRTWSAEEFEKLDVEARPIAIVQKLLKGLAEVEGRTMQENPWLKEDCHYHDHGEEKPCYKTMFTY